MKIKIKITRDILYRSQNCNSDNQKKKCAIALAIRDLWPNALVWGCGITGILPSHKRIPDNGVSVGYEIKFDWSVTEWISMFDKLEPEERIKLPEYSFDIVVPDEAIEKIGIDQAYKVLSESKTLELVAP